MMQSNSNRDMAGLGFLVRQAGGKQILVLGFMLVLTSLTEGFGLLLLVPITQAIAGQFSGIASHVWLKSMAQITPVGLLAIAVALVSARALIVYLTNERRRMLGLSLTNQLRAQAHSALIAADWRWLSRQNSADHAALIMGETVRAGNLVDHALSLATATVTLVVLLLAAALISPMLTLLLCAIGIVLAVPLLALRKGAARNAQEYSDVYSDLQGLVSNGLDHLRAARIAGATDSLSEGFSQASGNLRQHEKVYFQETYRTQGWFQVLVAAALAIATYFGVLAAEISIMIFIPVLAIAARSASMLMRVQQALHNWRYNLPALEQLLGLIEAAQSHREPQEITQSAVPCKAEIALRNVTFAYQGSNSAVLAGFDCSIPVGSVVAVRGASGSGKSTLADLLCGLLRPDSGAICVDGQALNDAQRMRWRCQTAYVEQSSYFFDGTIAENICWGLGQIEIAQMEAALHAASADFVFDQPDGFDTRIGESGRLFSGGELQRIALARGLIRQPDLLILDEISSGLDAQNRAFVRQSVANLKGQGTILLLSHDQEMLDIADAVLDLDAA
ncbi:MAG: ABC transporter ATP-binding protein [Erythrobacter sp.]